MCAELLIISVYWWVRSCHSTTRRNTADINNNVDISYINTTCYIKMALDGVRDYGRAYDLNGSLVGEICLLW